MTQDVKSAERLRDDGGVTLILMALAIVAIMIVAAMVVDLSNARTSRQDSKLVADSAGAAGLQRLADGGRPFSWSGASAALHYLEANDSEHNFTITYKNGLGTTLPSGPSPCTTSLSTPCLMTGTEAARKATWAWIQAADGDYVVNIKTGYHTPDPAFSEDTSAHSGDNGVPANHDCDQLAVIVDRTDPAFFGGIVGASDYDTTVRTVGRVNLGSINHSVPAFLMLERTACFALQNSVGGSSLGIIIRSPDGVQAGLAHVDSNATGSNCTGSARAVIGDTLPGGSPSITVDGSSDGTSPGVIAINALGPGGNAAFAYRNYPGGLSVEPQEGDIVSRAPVDSKYNTSPATISTVHADARALVNASGAPAGATTLTNSCNPTAADRARSGAIYISCTDFDISGNITFANATSVTFSGDVTPGNGEQISLPVASSIVIRGQLAYGGSSGLFSAPAVQNLYVKSQLSMPGGNHELRVNSTSSSSCTGGSSSATKVVVFGTSAMQLGGPTSLCSTFLFLAGSASSAYLPIQVTSGGSCSPLLPCPSNAMTGPALSIGAGQVVWSAPNQSALPLPAGSQGIEDLAFWTETSSDITVSSGGAVAGSGVFFAPNAHIDFSSPTLAIPRNAQFIARTLDLRQGTLEMRPVLTDAVAVPVDASPGLVR